MSRVIDFNEHRRAKPPGVHDRIDQARAAGKFVVLSVEPLFSNDDVFIGEDVFIEKVSNTKAEALGHIKTFFREAGFTWPGILELTGPDGPIPFVVLESGKVFEVVRAPESQPVQDLTVMEQEVFGLGAAA